MSDSTVDHGVVRPVLASILDLIGNTPLLRLPPVEGVSAEVEIYAKIEGRNPGGSVKDRPALRMIDEAEREGLLTRERAILDATSGNTGIAYALIGAARGYRVELALPSNVSEERKQVLKGYGAIIHYSSPFEGSDGAIRLARQMIATHPDRYYFPDQYNNPNNPRAHYETTAPEIWEQSQGRITHFVAAIGTSGTLMGTGRRLKELNPEVQVVALEPAQSLHGLEGLKHMATSIVPGIYDPSFPDRIVKTPTEPSYDWARRLASQGILVGMSSGAAMWGAVEVARTLRSGVVVTIFPDSGDRYLSTTLFE